MALRSPDWAMTRHALILGLALTGCQGAPESLVDLEDQSVQSMQNYADNASVALSGLRAWGMQGHRGWIDSLAEITVRDEVITVEVAGEEGVEVMKVIRPETTLQILRDYRSQVDALDARVAECDQAWAEAETEFQDSLDMRRQVREWLGRTGIQPEHIDAVTRALEGQLRSQP